MFRYPLVYPIGVVIGLLLGAAEIAFGGGCEPNRLIGLTEQGVRERCGRETEIYRMKIINGEIAEMVYSGERRLIVTFKNNRAFSVEK